MELKQIEFFLTLYEELNFTKASNKLFISQQGLSKSINNLESELGLPLFTRNTKEMKPTPYGHRLYHRFKDVASSVKNVYTEVDNIKNLHQGEVHLILSEGSMYYIPMDFLIGFQKAYPDIKVIYEEVTEKEADFLLKSKEWDVGILAEPITAKDFHKCNLFSEKYVAYMHKNHPLAEKETIHISDFNGEKLLYYREGYKLRSAFEVICSRKHIEPDIVFETTNPVYLLPLLEQNAGITFAIPSMFVNHLSENIVKRPIAWAEKCSYCLAWKKDGMVSSATRLFIQYILDYYYEQKNIMLLTAEERSIML